MCLLQGPTSCLSSTLQCHTWTVQSMWGNANQRENRHGLLGGDVIGESNSTSSATWLVGHQLGRMQEMGMLIKELLAGLLG